MIGEALQASLATEASIESLCMDDLFVEIKWLVKLFKQVWPLKLVLKAYVWMICWNQMIGEALQASLATEASIESLCMDDLLKSNDWWSSSSKFGHWS